MVFLTTFDKGGVMSSNLGINDNNKSLEDIYKEVSGSSTGQTSQTSATKETKEGDYVKDRIVNFEDAVLKMKVPDGKGNVPGLFPPNSIPASEGGKTAPPMDNQSTLMLELLLRLMTHDNIEKGMSLEDAEKQAEADAINSLGSAYQKAGLDPSDSKNAPKAVETTLTDFFQSEGTPSTQASAQAQAAGIVFSAAGPFMSWVNSINSASPVDQTSSAAVSNKDALYKTGINACQNGQDLLTSMKTALDNDPTVTATDKNAMANFMNLIGDVINQIKQLLIEIQIADSQKAGEMSAQKQDMSKNRYEATLKQLQDQFEQLWEAAHPPWWAKLLKILIPIITVIVAIVISVATAGAGSPAAAIASALIITAVTTALSQTGVLDKGMQAMMSGIVDMFKAMGCSEAVANILAAVLIAVVVAAVAKGAPGLTSKVASEATQNVIKMVCFQLALTYALSSGAISNLVLGCWEASGKSKDDPDLQKVQMAAAIAFAVIAIVAAGKFAPNMTTGQTTGKMAQLAQWIQKNEGSLKVVAGVLQAGGAGMSFAVNYVQFESLQKQGKLALSIAELEALVTLLNTMVTQLQSLIDQILTHGSEKGKEAAALNNSWETMVNNLQGAMNQLFAA